ncbi:hypothetical protein PICMEDRAFT_147381 [Pichia membranifaciens NRRL Y-2026]|uniref:Transmembrane protein n=1 Tax=Pichia membranifaciens NRRL Y-2026 TaxID=763406 RepID=A0A1E3NIP5_9ASCO|nr:hypothetical protein PICMEDRAFT_147381 [Pichia membranifaciens NRRL Y-2026]ODQ45936.1 hypothetical protein PICMEDRAFT_147381 [Pichia membranifaciens NRRL Y-2026]
MSRPHTWPAVAEPPFHLIYILFPPIYRLPTPPPPFFSHSSHGTCSGSTCSPQPACMCPKTLHSVPTSSLLVRPHMPGDPHSGSDGPIGAKSRILALGHTLFTFDFFFPLTLTHPTVTIIGSFEKSEASDLLLAGDVWSWNVCALMGFCGCFWLESCYFIKCIVNIGRSHWFLACWLLFFVLAFVKSWDHLFSPLLSTSHSSYSRFRKKEFLKRYPSNPYVLE